jgi:biotin carboxylase
VRGVSSNTTLLEQALQDDRFLAGRVDIGFFQRLANPSAK